MRRRRRTDGEEVAAATFERGEPEPGPAPVATAPRPWIDLQLVARRAGLNLLSATAEVEVVLTNRGELAADEVLVAVRLLGARSGQDEALGALFAEPIGRPATPAFALAVGEERRARVVAALSRDALEPLTAGGRPMFVPVVAVNVVYRWFGDGRGQTAGSWVVGVAQEGNEKLAPFWLDVPPRMHDGLGARPHALALRR